MSNDLQNPKNDSSLVSLLKKMAPEIKKCLPAHISPERLARIALTQVRTNPKLALCSENSFLACLMQAAQLGLEPGVLGSCYLIPRKNKQGGYDCTFMPGYRGFLDLARRSGEVVSLVARAVYEQDYFDIEYGINNKLIHRPALRDKGKIKAVYAIAALKDGGHQFDIMSVDDVEDIRKKSADAKSFAWKDYYDEMAKKTVVRRLFKWLPCSIEIQRAVVLDEQREAGVQNMVQVASEEFGSNIFDSQNMALGHNKNSEQLMQTIEEVKKSDTWESSALQSTDDFINELNKEDKE